MATMAARIAALASRPQRPPYLPESDVDALVRLLQSRRVLTHGLCAREACEHLGWNGQRVARARELAAHLGLIVFFSPRGSRAIIMRARAPQRDGQADA